MRERLRWVSERVGYGRSFLAPVEDDSFCPGFCLVSDIFIGWVWTVACSAGYKRGFRLTFKAAKRAAERALKEIGPLPEVRNAG